MPDTFVSQLPDPNHREERLTQMLRDNAPLPDDTPLEDTDDLGNGDTD